MFITIGRGKNRKTYQLPGGDVMARAAVNEPEAYRELHRNICEILRIPGY